MSDPSNDAAELMAVVKANRKPRPSTDLTYSAPSTEMECVLCSIWSDVLKIEPVGREDNLFLLGGDSLNMMQIATRIRQRYGAEITFAEFFENPTVAGLSATIEEQTS